MMPGGPMRDHHKVQAAVNDSANRTPEDDDGDAMDGIDCDKDADDYK